MYGYVGEFGEGVARVVWFGWVGRARAEGVGLVWTGEGGGSSVGLDEGGGCVELETIT